MSPPRIINYDEIYITLPASLNDTYFESKPISYSKYFESFEFKFNQLFNDFTLINPIEIQEFILLHDDLFDYLGKINELLRTVFKDNEYYLEFSSDPEIQTLSQLIVYVKSEEYSFDDDWNLLRILNKKIRSIEEFPSSLKRLLSVDLW